MSGKREYLRRYTNLESLRCILHNRAITLLDPQTWSDKNDSYFLHLYRQEKKLNSLFALCLTMVSERYHLWQVFSSQRHSPEFVGNWLSDERPYSAESPLATIGVRIRFDRNALTRAVENDRGIQHAKVEYKTIEELKNLALGKQFDPISKLPFLKRYGFQDEKEYRVIYASKREIPSKHISIPLSCINRVVISHKVSRRLFEDCKEQLHRIDGCETLRIVHSRLTDSRTWKRAGKKFIQVVQAENRR